MPLSIKGLALYAAAPAAPNTVYVSSLADFPAPVAGVITLADNTIYSIISNPNIGTNTITLGDYSIITGDNDELAIITYTGTGTMITSVNKNVEINDVSLICASGTLFSFSGTNTERIHIEHCDLRGCKNLGTVASINDFELTACSIENTVTNGLVASGNCDHISLHNNFCTNNAGVLFDFGTTTIKDAIISANFFLISGGQTGLSAGAFTASGQVLISSNSFSGAGTYVTGLDTSNVHVSRYANSGIDNTQKTGECYFAANATVTPIGVIGTYTKALGTTTAGTNSQFTATNNRLTCNALKTNDYLVSCSASLSSSAPNETLGCKIYKNGNPIAGSEQEIRVAAAGQSNNGTAKSIVPLGTGDYVELWVTDKSGTNNVTVEYMNFTVR